MFTQFSKNPQGVAVKDPWYFETLDQFKARSPYLLLNFCGFHLLHPFTGKIRSSILWARRRQKGASTISLKRNTPAGPTRLIASSTAVIRSGSATWCSTSTMVTTSKHSSGSSAKLPIRRRIRPLSAPFSPLPCGPRQERLRGHRSRLLRLSFRMPAESPATRHCRSLHPEPLHLLEHAAPSLRMGRRRAWRRSACARALAHNRKGRKGTG